MMENSTKKINYGMKSLVAWVVAIALVFGVVIVSKREVKAADPITYYDPIAGENKTISDYTVITDTITDYTTVVDYNGKDGYTISDGWYVVNSDVTVSDVLFTSGDVNIIVCDGASMTFAERQSIWIKSGTLTIYGQESETGKITIMQTNQGSEKHGYSSAIYVPTSCSLVINGAVTETSGGLNSEAAIGAGNYGAQGGTLTINRGELICSGSSSSAAISMTQINMNGGVLNANGNASKNAIRGNFTYSNGVVEIKCQDTSSFYAFDSAPTIQGYPSVRAGSNSDGTGSEIIMKSTWDSSFVSSKYIKIAECPSHDIESGECKYCGVKAISSISLPDFYPPRLNMTPQTSVTFEQEGIKPASTRVTWYSYEPGPAYKEITTYNETSIEAGKQYYVEIGFQIEPGYIIDPNAKASLWGKNDVLVRDNSGGNGQIEVSSDTVKPFSSEVILGDYDLTYEYGDNIEIPVEAVVVDDEIAAADLPEITSPELTYTVSDNSVAKLEADNTITAVGVGTFTLNVEMKAGSFYLTSNATSEEITIAPKNISGLTDITIDGNLVASYPGHPYNGEIWEPAIEVQFDGETLVEDVDYVFVCPEDMKNIGVKSCNIIYKGNYTGSDAFDIEVIRDSVVSILPQKDSEGNTGMTIDPTGGLATQSGLEAEMADVIYTADDGYYFPEDYASNVTYTITKELATTVATSSSCGVSVERLSNKEILISGYPEYTTTVKLPAATKILERDATIIGLDSEYDCGIGNITPMVKDATGALNDKSTFASSDSNVAVVDASTGKITTKKPGKFKVIATIAADDTHLKTVVESKEITVNAIDISKSVQVSVVGGNSREYDATEWKPELTVKFKDSGKELVSGVDYKIVYPEDMISAGSKVIAVEFIGIYKGTANVGVTIEELVILPVFEMPEIPYSLEGIKGENDYYTSEVVFVAPAGYLISKSPDGKFARAISFDRDVLKSSIYLYQKDNGTISEAIDIPDMLIDISKPSLGELQDNKTYYVSEYELSVSDDNLAAIYINGELVELTGNKMSIKLSANDGSEEYVIRVVDKAGNVTEMKVVVSEEWMFAKIIPINKPVNLRTNSSYKLGEGTWVVEGDSTTYQGGSSFYVRKEGKYIFKEAQ